MKILIDGAKIVTFREDKPVINEGYVFINKGIVVAVGEGPPPPEYEFAEYVIDGRGRVVMPGFVLGIPDLLQLPFRYISRCSRNPRECIESVSKDELRALIEVSLTILSFGGATSIVALANTDYVDVVAKAVSKCWVRTRLLFKNRDELCEGVRTATKSIVDQDAIPKGILSFGVLSKGTVDVSQDELRSLNAFAYVDSCNDDVARKLQDRLTCINTSSELCTRKVVVDAIELWRGEEGIAFTNPRLSHPRSYIQMLRFNGLSPKEITRVLSSANPWSLNIGVPRIVEGATADIIILNFREPPHGPTIFDDEGLYELICDNMYSVETVIVAGDLVVDRFEPLMIGRKEFETVKRVRSELIR